MAAFPGLFPLKPNSPVIRFPTLLTYDEQRVRAYNA